MEIPVLLMPVNGNQFRAKSGEPLSITTEGSSREEALSKLRQQLENLLGSGAEITTVRVCEHPLARFAGMFKDDPLFEKCLIEMAENRDRADQEEGIE